MNLGVAPGAVTKKNGIYVEMNSHALKHLDEIAECCQTNTLSTIVNEIQKDSDHLITQVVIYNFLNFLLTQMYEAGFTKDILKNNGFHLGEKPATPAKSWRKEQAGYVSRNFDLDGCRIGILYRFNDKESKIYIESLYKVDRDGKPFYEDNIIEKEKKTSLVGVQSKERKERADNRGLEKLEPGQEVIIQIWDNPTSSILQILDEEEEEKREREESRIKESLKELKTFNGREAAASKREYEKIFLILKDTIKYFDLDSKHSEKSSEKSSEGFSEKSSDKNKSANKNKSAPKKSNNKKTPSEPNRTVEQILPEPSEKISKKIFL